jgi:DNA-binding transcriptional regulator YiaG
MTASQLRVIRSRLELTGDEFARLVGAADARSVRRWEAGTNDVPGSTRQLLKLLIAMSPAQLKRAMATLMKD